MQPRRLIEAVTGIFFLLLAFLFLFEVWQIAAIMALIGVVLLAHQARLGRRARRARPVPPPQRPDDAQWSSGEDWSRTGKAIGYQIGAIIQASVRKGMQEGWEEGFEELGRQIEWAIHPPRSEPPPSSTHEESSPRPTKPRMRRAQLTELGSDEAYAHAVDAARAAGLELSRTVVIPVDVGVIAFLPGGERAIHRTTPVEPDAEFIQPFVQLNMPTRAAGRIRYELVDSDGQTLFIHEENQSLRRGVNLLTPPSRLRAHGGMARFGDWRLLVEADGVPLLDHKFGWAEDSRARLRRHLHEDGELTPEARNLLDEETSGPGMSLDDLIGEQDASSRAARR
ncbi:MAG: hypothetical protein JNL34_05920 [Anaerolineae bacterium]|nr:hypothetical protein [Anaerolineae bacterium]